MKRSSARRWLVLSVCLLSLSVPGSTARGQEEGDRSAPADIAGFEATADAFAVGVSALVSEVVPLPIEVYVDRALAKADSAPRATAVAGPLDVPIGAALSLLGVPIGVPTSCTANFPGFPDRIECGAAPGGAVGNQPVGAAAGHAEASGDPDDPTSPKASALAITTSSGSPLFALSQGESESSTKVDSGRVVSDGAVRVDHFEIAGNLLDLRNVSTVAHAESNGQPGQAIATSKLSATGGTIAGLVPFDLTADGIVFTVPGLPKVPVVGIQLPIPPGDTSIPVPLADRLRTVLNPVLGAAGATGLSIRVIPGTTDVAADGGQAESTSGVIEIVYSPAGQSDQYRILVGQAMASAFAVSAGDTSSGPGLDDGGLPPAEGDLGGTGGAALSPTGGSTAGGSGAGGQLASLPGRGESRPPEASLPGVSRIATRFRTAYGGGALGIVLGALACVALLGRKKERTMFSSARRTAQ